MFKVVEKTGSQSYDKRYVIISEESGEILDDAQGYGYKSFQSAQKAGWYKFKGGKQKTQETRKLALAFWKANKTFSEFCSEFFEWNAKQIALGEVSEKELLEAAKEQNINGFQLKFLDYL